MVPCSVGGQRRVPREGGRSQHRPALWGLTMSHWPHGDSESRSLSQFFLEIGFFFVQGDGEGNLKGNISHMPVKSLPQISHPF